MFLPLAVSTFKTNELAPYLTKVLNRTYRNTIIAKIRLSSHPLLIETGRYTGIPRAERICGHRNSRDIEDEDHFVLICSKSNRKAMNKNWGNQKTNPALKTKTGNK